MLLGCVAAAGSTGLLALLLLLMDLLLCSSITQWGLLEWLLLLLLGLSGAPLLLLGLPTPAETAAPSSGALLLILGGSKLPVGPVLLVLLKRRCSSDPADERPDPTAAKGVSFMRLLGLVITSPAESCISNGPAGAVSPAAKPSPWKPCILLLPLPQGLVIQSLVAVNPAANLPPPLLDPADSWPGSSGSNCISWKRFDRH
jgi:hypothetical protein